MKNRRYYDLVASICDETCRTDCHLICGGFRTEKEAIRYYNDYGISESDYYKYCQDDETVYIEIEERDDLSGELIDIIPID